MRARGPALSLTPVLTLVLVTAVLSIGAAVGEAHRLGPGENRVDGTLDGSGDPPVGDTVTVTLGVGDWLGVEVEQLGVDLHLRLLDPAGDPQLAVDSHTGDSSHERLDWVAEVAGEHRLEILPFAGERGDYRLVAWSEPATEGHRLAARGTALVADPDPGGRVDRLREALRLFHDAGAAPAIGDAYDRLGRALDPNSVEAHDAFARAANVFTSLGDSRRAGLVRIQLARAKQRAGDIRGAELELEQAVDELVGDRRERRHAYSSLGIVRRQLGDAQGAIEAYDEALALARSLGEGVAATLHNLAVAWHLTGDHRRALDLLREVIDKPDAAAWRAATLDKIGQIHARLGEDAEAIEALDRAYALRLRDGDARGVAVTLSSYALAHRLAGRWAEAEAAYRRCLESLESVDAPRTRAIALSQLARLEIRRGAVDSAEPRLREALAIHRRRGDAQGEAGVGLDLARWHWARGDLDAAVDAMEAALAKIDALRASLRDLSLLDADSTRRDARYHEAVDLTMALDAARPGEGWAAKALETSERGRGRSLLRLLEAAQSDLEPAVDGGLDLVVDGRVPVLDAATIRALVDPGVVVLEFDLGAERSWLFRVDRGSIRGLPLASADELEGLARRVHKLLANSHRPEARASLDATLCELSRELLGPVVDTLEPGTSLVVVPDGALYLVPFALLPVPAPGTTGCGRPLLDAHASAVLPSMSALGSLRRRASEHGPSNGRRWALVAAPAYVDSPPLPFARREAERLGALGEAAFGADRVDRFVGVDADVGAILDGALSSHAWIHFATHAVVDPDRAERSWLTLSEREADGSRIDGRLTVSDLMSLELRAELVTLSACRSALGREVRGEGWPGLARAFFHAGARRLLVSLWDVDDAATAHFMEAFYRRILSGSSPPEAVVAAQDAVRSDPRWRAPYYWAGFVLVGDPLPIPPIAADG